MGVENVFRPGMGFYKICSNPLGTLSNRWYYCPTDGSESTWVSGTKVKSKVYDDRWDMEMAIPLKAILPEGGQPDNAQFIFQFVRADTCGGVYYVGWAAGDWQSWPRFPELVLDPKAPAIQFTRVGDLQDGKLDALVHVHGDQPVTVKTRVLNKAGVALYDEQKTITTGGEAVFSKSTNWRWTTATTLSCSPAPPPTARCFIASTTHQKDDAGLPGEIPGPLAGRQPRAGDYHFDVSYWPYYRKVDIGVDVDFFGVSQEILAAPKFDVTLTGADGKALAKGDGELGRRKARCCWMSLSCRMASTR